MERTIKIEQGLSSGVLLKLNQLNIKIKKSQKFLKEAKKENQKFK